MLELNDNLKKRNKITTYHILTQNIAQILKNFNLDTNNAALL